MYPQAEAGQVTQIQLQLATLAEGIEMLTKQIAILDERLKPTVMRPEVHENGNKALSEPGPLGPMAPMANTLRLYNESMRKLIEKVSQMNVLLEI